MNIIIDLRRCKLDERVAKARIKYINKNRRHKKGKVLVISKKGPCFLINTRGIKIPERYLFTYKSVNFVQSTY